MSTVPSPHVDVLLGLFPSSTSIFVGSTLRGRSVRPAYRLYLLLLVAVVVAWNMCRRRDIGPNGICWKIKQKKKEKKKNPQQKVHKTLEDR